MIRVEFLSWPGEPPPQVETEVFFPFILGDDHRVRGVTLAADRSHLRKQLAVARQHLHATLPDAQGVECRLPVESKTGHWKARISLPKEYMPGAPADTPLIPVFGTRFGTSCGCDSILVGRNLENLRPCVCVNHYSSVVLACYVAVL